ncbi:MAG: ferrochelatase, partial [Thermomicrobiales bacterium]
SYSGCRQYRENIINALNEIGGDAIQFDKIRVFYNHPGYVGPMAETIKTAIASFPEDRRAQVEVVFTAHSIPDSMARNCAYEAQLLEACRLVAEAAGAPNYRLCYQSRSGAPHIPWLEPDIIDQLDALHAEGKDDVIVSPIGFISDHLEVLYDLDDEAQTHAAELGMTMVRGATVGTHPEFVAMIRELIVERMTDDPIRRALGTRGANHDICPVNCCLSGAGRPAPVPAAAT